MKYRFTVLCLISSIGIACSSLDLKDTEYKQKLSEMVPQANKDLRTCQQQFSNLKNQTSSMIMYPGANLQDQFVQLQDQYELTQDCNEDTRYWTQEINERATKLFRSWDKRLELYQNTDLRYESLSNLQNVQQPYQRYHQNMQRIDTKMEIVLNEYYDMMLFMNQNLNQNSLKSLQNDLKSLQNETDELTSLIDQTISISQEFLNALNASETSVPAEETNRSS